MLSLDQQAVARQRKKTAPRINTHALFIQSFVVVYRLLDILADRKARSRVWGTVLFNARPREDNFRFSTGYVVQVH